MYTWTFHGTLGDEYLPQKSLKNHVNLFVKICMNPEPFLPLLVHLNSAKSVLANFTPTQLGLDVHYDNLDDCRFVFVGIII